MKVAVACRGCGGMIRVVKSLTSGESLIVNAEATPGGKVVVKASGGEVVTAGVEVGPNDARHEFHVFKCADPTKILATPGVLG